MKKGVIFILVLVTILLYGCEEQPVIESKEVPFDKTPKPLIDNAEERIAEPVIEELPGPPGNEVGSFAPIKQFDIIAKQWEFIPNEIKVNKDDTVILNIKSIGVNHGFMLTEFGVNEFLSPNKQITVEFVADKSGEFEFSCNVPCGSGHGRMRGQLIVN